jgi:hypothetical protein
LDLDKIRSISIDWFKSQNEEASLAVKNALKENLPSLS